VTTNMRNAAEQAAYEFGRAAAKYEMAIDVEAVHGMTAAAMAGNVIAESASNGSRNRPGPVGRKAKAGPVGAPKAPAIARGVKTTPAPRAKGVKDAIVSLMSGNPDGLTQAKLGELTGFKAASVAGTLQKLQKDGLVSREGRVWTYIRGGSIGSEYEQHDAGNSETAGATI
jgi:hypothetical protein